MARPRNTESDSLILAEAAKTLANNGYDGLVVDELARTVGVAKTTVYRRWPTKNHLVVSVIAEGQGAEAVPNSGDSADDVADDLTTIVGGMCRTLDPPPMRRLVAELAAARLRDDDLREAIDRLWADRRAATATILERGIASGALRGDLDPGVVIDELAGAVYYRVLITGGALDDAYALALVRTVMAGAR